MHGALGKKGADQKLRELAEEVRQHFPLPEGAAFATEGDGNLGRVNKMAALYEASTIYSRYFAASDVPDDEDLTTDINVLLGIYASYAEYALNSAPTEEPDDDFHGRRVWAISAGEGGSQWEGFLSSGVVAIAWGQLGSLESYKSREEITEALTHLRPDGSVPSNDSLACYQFCNEINEGDIVIAKQGRKRILGMGLVKSGYQYREGERYPNVREVDWIRADPTEWPGSGITPKTLTEIDMASWASTRELVLNYLDLGDVTSVVAEEEGAALSESYGVLNIVSDGSFLLGSELNGLLATLKRKKNLILQGPPGTGKTWLAKRLAFALMGRKDYSRMRAVQFHPNLSYEDFVRGWRPTGGSDGRLQLADGPFLEMVEDARNSTYPHVLVIEEVNRGNPAQVFGELLTLMEADKRSPEDALELSYRRFHGERVYVPPNLFVIGTMNIADRSLAIVDMALRRRFAFFDMDPQFNARWKSWLLNQCGFDGEFIDRLSRRIEDLNATIESDPALGPQFRVGHSFLTPSANADVSDSDSWYDQVVQTELSPLIREYWFDDPDKAADLIASLVL